MLLSALIALVSGLLFDLLVDKKVLAENPNRGKNSLESFEFWKSAKKDLKHESFTQSLLDWVDSYCMTFWFCVLLMLLLWIDYR